MERYIKELIISILFLTKGLVNASYTIYHNNKEYESTTIKTINSSISVIEFESNDVIEVLNNKVIEQSIGINLTVGQTLVTIGNSIFGRANSISVGTLSKDSLINTEFFMYDSKVDLNKAGAPIFNLDGELVGINLKKVNTIETSSGELPSEGLVTAYDINKLAHQLQASSTTVSNYRNYESKVEYELKIINLTKDNLKKDSYCCYR